MLVPRFLYPILPYRSFISPILVLSAIVVPCWLLFRLYRLRAKGQRLSISREILLLMFVAYLSALAAVTLTMSHPSREVAEASVPAQLRPSRASLTCSSPSMPMGSPERGFCVRNARGNLLLFFPLGILIPLVWRRLRFSSALAIATALSLSIEVAQYISRAWGSHRSADINDVILNVAGAFVGLAVVFLLRLGRGSAGEIR
jgi:glycopeptide antibiotics resistance protein